MASELATRMPLMQKQQHHAHWADSQMDGSKCQTAFLTSLSVQNLQSGMLSQMSHVSDRGMEHCTSGSEFGSENSHNFGISYMLSGGFRYQIRRPVESWKFLEARKQDGSILYLCRICNSSYKHKKSLNKHWKDKHSDIPHPDGAPPDDDEDDEEPSDGEGQTTDHGSTISEVENVENIPPVSGNCQVTTGSNAFSDVVPTTVVLAGRSFTTGLRRASAPLMKGPGSTLQPKRMSIALAKRNPGDGEKTTAQSNNANERDCKKRLRPGETNKEAIASGMSSSPRKSSPATHVSKRRPSCFYEKDWYGSCTNEKISTVEYTEKPSHVRSLNSSTSTVRSPDRTIQLSPNRDMTSKSSPKANSNELKPLDLSLLKTTDDHQATPCAKKYNELFHLKKSTPDISCSLLIGLLQTALNTLKSETSDSGIDTGLRLSRTSASMLFAIGTLLVALVDEKKDDISFEKAETTTSGVSVSVPGKSDDHLGEEEDARRTPIRSQRVSECSQFKQVLPPAPQHSSQSSALEPPQVPEYDQSSQSNIYHARLSSPGQKTIQQSYVESCELGTTLVNHLTQGFGSTHTHIGCDTQSPYNAQCRSQIDHTIVPHVSNSKAEVLQKPVVNETNKSTSSSYECVISCPVCKFDARWFSELRAHMVNHSEHRMFGCCYCPYRAKWKWDVAKHMRRCPLGRHVAHLSNEALLRIVRYHPPPVGNILYNYFPQYGIPGVGVEHPPTPPVQQYMDEVGATMPTLIAMEPASISSVTPTNTLYPSLSINNNDEGSNMPGTSPVNPEPPVLGRYGSTPSGSHEPTGREGTDDQESAQSPQALVIVDNEADYSPVIQTPTEADSDKSTPIMRGQNAVACQTNGSDNTHAVSATEVTTSSGLVFRLRRCSHCTFHSADEQEFRTHMQYHHDSAIPHPNTSQ
ncbi:hypothetical protein CSKR_103421 [Clonorchis sinensis]|uniref:Uncharacterized protein n=2 Tax=Clonorchis sinensis TaxID=79923 RepID=G7YB30_CLOSI|nr:hypothetical protein CSKR_103421 [Clonorchis sinensis]GAA50164.1 hypothetical protein CLF_104142 [Clonorchis sinensis]